MAVSFIPEYWIEPAPEPDPPAPEPTPCEELGRVSRAYVSAHDRTRVHGLNLYSRERRCLVANFNGAIPKARTIASAVWDMESPCAVGMSGAAIVGREAQVMLSAVRDGVEWIRCEVTLDNGEVYNQLFRVEVLAGPQFGDTGTAGPSRLTATA